MSKFIQLTAVNDYLIFVNTDHIVMLINRQDGLTGIKTLNTDGGAVVKESYEEVKKLIAEA